MGKRKSKPKKKKTKVQQAAAKRHATFKKTRVQTFGGTRKASSYSKKEIARIDAAGLSRSAVTGGKVADKKPVASIAPKKPERSDFPNTRSGAVEYAGAMTKFKIADSPSGRAAAYEKTLDPNSFRGLADGATTGVGPVASGDAYARGMATDGRSVENRLRQTRNIISNATIGIVPKVRLLPAKEIADRRADPFSRTVLNSNRDPRQGGGSGGSGGGGQTRVAAQVLQQQQQPTTGATGYDPVIGQTGLDNSELTRIQNQAYDATFGAYTTGSGGSLMSSNVNTGTSTPGPTAGPGRGKFNLRMFSPLAMRRGGPRDLLNRRGLRITSLNV